MIVGGGNRTYRFKLEPLYKEVESIVEQLSMWISAPNPEAPPILLNEHCPCCPFKKRCEEKAKEIGDLSLLGGMTAKTIAKYHKKGIFSVTQLSYLFRPRKKDRNRQHSQHRIYRPEVHALAVRTEKIYVQELPYLQRHSLELFIDIEGVPDQDFYYLIGLTVVASNEQTYYPFWADSAQDEKSMWRSFVEKVDKYADAPIYHYGAYDGRAIHDLNKRYGNDENVIERRLVNVNSLIFGRIYFPVRSNALKDLGAFLGATWTCPEASGLQSLVWRYYWNESQDEKYRNLLITYNEEDCKALLALTDKISDVIRTADSLWNIDFADQPKKLATEIGNQVHEELEQMLKFAYADYSRNRIRLKSTAGDGSAKNGQQQRAKPSYVRIIPKAGKTVLVPRRRRCSNCGNSLNTTERTGEITVTDLVPTRGGYKKTVTRYIGRQSRCPACRTEYIPRIVRNFNRKKFGHSFIAWTVYLRIVLRLPYEIIAQVMEDMFNERTALDTLLAFVYYFAQYYTRTERLLVQRILGSPFIHIDETRISIKGEDCYVWVFTDGSHVVFRLTKTREASIVHEFLAKYNGIVISDFYGGYDSVKCRQQKCWSHLIGDLNDDLWKEPFNGEFESFVREVSRLILPILLATKKYGLKRRHLHKFRLSVDRFYSKNIEDNNYKSEVTLKYQKRFRRFRNSLFTFLDEDGISWSNNMAERALKPVAVQRKISGSFWEKGASNYLLLLGMAQSCKFQRKPFLKFLMSRETDIDKYVAPKPLRYSQLHPSEAVHGTN
jgi:transposase